MDAIGAAALLLVGLALGLGLAAYHYRDIVAGQAAAIEALEDYIRDHEEADPLETIWGDE